MRYLLLLLALGCVPEVTESVLPTQSDLVDRAGRRAVEASDPSLRRDWYGRVDNRRWLDRGSYFAASAKTRCGGVGTIESIEGPLNLYGDCTMLAPRSMSRLIGREIMVRGGPGVTLQGWTRGGVLDVAGKEHRVSRHFRVAVEQPGLHRARIEGRPSTLHVHVTDPVAPPPTTVRNAILVVIDTLRADRLRPFNPDSRVQMPNLELVAQHADVFERAFATASWTKPTVGSLLTGRYPWQHRALTHTAHLRDDVRTLPETLADFGVHTLAISGNGYVSPAFGFARGFDEFSSVGALGRGRLDDEVTLLFEKVDELGPSNRFFAYVHATDPHSPYEPPAALLHQYDPDPYEGPISFENNRTLLRELNRGERSVTPRDVRRLQALYDAEVASMDAAIGRLFRGLAERRMLRDTLVILVADHGEELHDHGGWGHGSGRLHQELVRVPLLMWWPGVSAGRRVDRVASQIDVPVTVLEAMNLEQDLGSPSSQSLRQLPGHRFVLFGQRDSRRGVTDGHLSLVRDRNGQFEFANFDASNENDERADAHTRRYLTQGLAHEMGRNRTYSRPNRLATVDDALTNQLRALGYVGDE